MPQNLCVSSQNSSFIGLINYYYFLMYVEENNLCSIGIQVSENDLKNENEFCFD